MKLLIDFDVIVNTDISVCNIIKEKYNKLLSKEIEITEDLIVNRYNPNPLEIISIDSISEDNLNSIYEELMINEYENILKGSYCTDIIRYLSLLYDIENVNIFIRCKNVLEKKYIRNINLYDKFNIIISDELDITCDVYIFKIYDYKYITKLNNKKIFIPNFRFNEMLLSIGNLIYLNNDVSIINIFKKSNLKG